MSSRKYEKATSANSFWKTSPISAVPGRPNPSSSKAPAFANPSSVGGGQALPPFSAMPSSSSSSSFSAFDASVSDAWALQEGEEEEEELHRRHRQRTTQQQQLGSSNGQKGLFSSTSSTIYKSNSVDAFAEDGPQSASIAEETKAQKLERLLLSASEDIDLEALRKLAWSGLSSSSPRSRSKAWKILCGYLPGAAARQGEVLARKQEEYRRYVQQYYHPREEQDDFYRDTFRQIQIDIPRMSPVIALFQQRCVQEMFQRILYLWSIRHPGSGYVQGINDLVTPFFLVFLQDYVDKELTNVDVAQAVSEEHLNAIEADSFWCLTKVLDGIHDNYTVAQPGIQQKVRQLEELVERIDGELHSHLTQHEVQFLQFAFRWMNNVLMRELPIRATIRLWDTYLSEMEGFSRFHLYVCAAFLIHWKAELLKKSDFHTLLMFLQNLPTAKWGDEEINLLVAEAYRLSYLFADAPSHLSHLGKSKK